MDNGQLTMENKKLMAWGKHHSLSIVHCQLSIITTGVLIS